MSNSCFYCGQEHAIPHQRMICEERCGEGGSSSEKDAMFRYSEPMKLAYRLLKVDDDDDDDMPPEVMQGLLDLLLSIGAVEDDAQPQESKDEQIERQRQMELGLHPRPYANITTEELEGNLLWMIKPEHAEERKQVLDELNLRGHTSIDMQPNTDNNQQAMSRVFNETDEYPDFGIQNADERMAWQDQMKGEPMDIAWQLLKND
mgnify:CR=1 FL=1|tara:strand:+ start:2715 stop:3326 length:612 start_codon:yes stop_codon:yes gene_type:complete